MTNINNQVNDNLISTFRTVVKQEIERAMSPKKNEISEPGNQKVTNWLLRMKTPSPVNETATSPQTLNKSIGTASTLFKESNLFGDITIEV